MKYPIIIITLLTLSACTEHTTTYRYSCNTIPAELVVNEQQATLNFNNENYILNSEISASGAKYANKDALFWGKGEQAMMIINGEKYQCAIINQ